MKLKKDKGIGLTDAIIAIAIFIIFSSFIISVSYNIYIQANYIKRNDTATNYIVELFEYAKLGKIENINYDYLSDYAHKFGNNVHITSNPANNLNTGYTIYINVKDIKDIAEDYSEYNTNIVKQIDITVYYNLSNKIKSVSMSTLITK